MKEIKRIIKVSVDDGDKLDIKLGEILLKYRIPTTFYIAPNYSDLDDSVVYRIARGGLCMKKKCPIIFDVGGHTMNHPLDLKKLDDNELKNEIFGCKKYLENLIEKPVTKFCYPRGRFDERVKDVVKEAGFTEARTVRVLNTDFPTDPFETDVSVHVHPARKEYGDSNWITLGLEMLDKVIKDGGRFELMCHSWEIDRFNMWEFFEDFISTMDEKMKEINYERKVY